MWGREMRAGLVFVLLSLAAGSLFREWKRSHETSFADLVRDLETSVQAAPGVLSDASRADSGAAPEIDRGGSTAPDAPGPRTLRHHRSEALALRPGGIDLDRAGAAELERLPGIGPSLARRIVEDRKRRGPFGDPAALRRVRGIGPRIFERVRPFLAPALPADSGSPIAN